MNVHIFLRSVHVTPRTAKRHLDAPPFPPFNDPENIMYVNDRKRGPQNLELPSQK